jgi:hypothetical protein
MNATLVYPLCGLLLGPSLIWRKGCYICGFAAWREATGTFDNFVAAASSWPKK